MAVRLLTPLDRRRQEIEIARGQQKDSGVDKIAKALGIAGQITGIAANVAGISENIANRKLKADQLATAQEDLRQSKDPESEKSQAARELLTSRGIAVEPGLTAERAESPLFKTALGAESQRAGLEAKAQARASEAQLRGLQIQELEGKIGAKKDVATEKQQKQVARKVTLDTNLENLDGIIAELSPQNGKPPRVSTGRGAGLLDVATFGAGTKFANPELADIKDRLTGIVFQSLKETLGAQFTQKEAERLVEAEFNISLPTEKNVERLKRMRRKIEGLVGKPAAARKALSQSKEKAKPENKAKETVNQMSEQELDELLGL